MAGALTRDTWLRYARQFNEARGLTDDGIWDKRTHPAWQFKVMGRLADDQAAALAKIGAPQTYGNMYLVHFAGEGGARKLLTAAPDTPVEQLLTPRAIEANSFLKGKTAEDVIAWAHRKVGDRAHGGAVLAREDFASDGAWAAAQRELDDAEAAQAATEAAGRGEDRPGVDDEEVPFVDSDGIPNDAAAAARGEHWAPMDDPTVSTSTRWLGALATLRRDEAGEAKGALWHREAGPIDVKWGTPGDPARNWKGGSGLSHILAKHPEMEAVIERLPEMIAAMDVKQKRPQRLVLESPTHEASIALTWHDQDARWLVTAYEKSAPADPTSVRGPGEDESGSSRPGADANILADREGGKEAELLRQYWARETAEGRPLKAVHAVRADDGTLVDWAPTKHNMTRRLVEDPDSGTLVKIEPPEERPVMTAEGFDDPEGMEVDRQLDSLAHDLKQLMEADEAAGAMMVRVNDEGDPISLADAMEDLDDDDAAIEAAKRCL